MASLNMANSVPLSHMSDADHPRAPESLCFLSNFSVESGSPQENCNIADDIKAALKGRPTRYGVLNNPISSVPNPLDPSASSVGAQESASVARGEKI